MGGSGSGRPLFKISHREETPKGTGNSQKVNGPKAFTLAATLSLVYAIPQILSA